MNVFCFSGSCVGPHSAGGSPVLVGAIFQKASKLQALQKSSDLLVWCSTQCTVSLFTGEYMFPCKRWQSFLSITDVSFYIRSAASLLWDCAHIVGIAMLY